MAQPNLKYFRSHEFKGYWTKMDAALLTSLDSLRHEWRRQILITPAPGGVGRETGNSYHNWVKHGTVKAIDIFTACNSLAEIENFIALAQRSGMHGVGYYPEWEPRSLGAGFHLDVGGNKGRTWSGIKNHAGEQVYVALSEGFKVSTIA